MQMFVSTFSALGMLVLACSLRQQARWQPTTRPRIPVAHARPVLQAYGILPTAPPAAEDGTELEAVEAAHAVRQLQVDEVQLGQAEAVDSAAAAIGNEPTAAGSVGPPETGGAHLVVVGAEATAQAVAVREFVDSPIALGRRLATPDPASLVPELPAQRSTNDG